MSTTTGQFFNLLLLAATPTALGRALNDNPATIADWNNALQKRKEDDPSVIAALSKILTLDANAPVFNALLTKTNYEGQMVPVGQVIAQLVWGIGITQGVLNQTWSKPPHPQGTTDIPNLINALAGLANFDETH